MNQRLSLTELISSQEQQAESSNRSEEIKPYECKNKEAKALALLFKAMSKIGMPTAGSETILEAIDSVPELRQAFTDWLEEVKKL